MELLQQIRHLVNRRDAAQRQVEDIDRQLAQVRAALGMPSVGSPVRSDAAKPPRKRYTALGGLSQSQIKVALEKQQPQSVAMLKQEFPDMTTLGVHLAGMTHAGVLHRRRKHDGGAGYWYALDVTAFSDDEFVNPEETSDGDTDEPG
jgi:hypothetical protein